MHPYTDGMRRSVPGDVFPNELRALHLIVRRPESQHRPVFDLDVDHVVTDETMSVAQPFEFRRVVGRELDQNRPPVPRPVGHQFGQ